MSTKCKTKKLDVESYMSKMVTMANEMASMIDCIELPEAVNEALNKAFNEMPTSEGEMKALEHLFEPEKAAEHEKHVFTYATRFGQLKLIKDGQKWRIQSEISYFDKEYELPVLLSEISNDIELLEHIIVHTKKGDVGYFLE